MKCNINLDQYRKAENGRECWRYLTNFKLPLLHIPKILRNEIISFLKTLCFYRCIVIDNVYNLMLKS